MTALGDDKAPLEADLRRRFPAALIWPADDRLARWAEQIVRFVTAPGEQPDLPLDIRGTAFQARVWRALQKVPPGKTSTYTEIAAALGQPKAVRAVRRACAANKLALLVPCHRIVRRDGDLAGYRWGVERKRALLAGGTRGGRSRAGGRIGRRNATIATARAAGSAVRIRRCDMRSIVWSRQ